MGREDLKRSLKNVQERLRARLRLENQHETSGSHAPDPRKQILAIARFDDAPIKELWNSAYENLRVEDGALIEEYEKKLQGNMAAGLGSMLNVSMRDRMQAILECKMNEVNANTWKLKFRSSEVEVRDLVQPILGAVSLVNEYIIDAISISPYASLAWAGISLLLPLFTNPSTQMASLAKGLEFISTLIAQSRMREDLYLRHYELKIQKDQPLQQSHYEYKSCLERLYRQILKFQAKAYCYLTDSSASRFCIDIIKQNGWKQLLDGVREQEAMFVELSATWRDIRYDNECLAADNRHQETMNLWFTVGTNVSNLERAIQESQNQRSRIDLLEWLCSINHTELYNSARRSHAYGTGEWLINRAEIFKAWEKSTTLKSFLWLHGKAGSGKSILSSSVIKHLQDQHKSNATHVLAYFYFSFSDPQKQTVDGMISSLIRQISARRPYIPQAVQSLGDFKNGGGRPDTETLIEALLASIQGFSTVYVIIDALDECPIVNDERKKLLNSLRHILKAAPDSLHMFCTSRKEIDIDKAIRPLLLEPWGEEVDLSNQIDVLNDDIAQYIDFILADTDYDTWPESIKKESKRVLMEKADGMFQYVHCQFDNLQKLSSMDAVRKALQSLPSGLDLTYSRMLQSIDASVQSQFIASLKWLACSMYPLRIGLLAKIFVLPSTPDNGFEKSSPLFSPMDVLKYFPGLIVIEQGKYHDLRKKSKEDLFVRLAHFSIKEYLTSDRISQSRASSFAFNDSEAHTHIGRLCLAYHLQINSMTGISDLYQHENKYAKELIEYASLYWAQHLEKIPYTSWPIEISQNAILSLSIGSQSLLTMVTDYHNYLSPVNDAVYKYQKRMQIHKDLVQRPHCYTATRGFRQLTERLISRGFGVNKYLTQGDLDEGLRYATKTRRKSVAKLFLDNGAQIHNCLKKAAEQGDAAIVGLLLDHGSETNPLTTKLESALQAALWNGHIDVLKLLLSRGADVNSPFRRAQRVTNAKHYSIGRQPYVADCLHFLFDSGAGVNMNADCSLTAALYAAIWKGYTKVARQLLDRGADVNELAGQDGYPLQAAVAQIMPDIEFIRYLLDLGAAPNSQAGSTNTALQAAYSSARFIPLLPEDRKKFAEVIELLLNKGADVTIKGGKHGTALQAACGNDNVAISNIQMLLQKGADVNDQGGEYGTALQAACLSICILDQGCKLELVQLLLSHGADVGAEGGYYGTALQAACARQLEHEPVANEDMVRLLISAGADVNTQGGRYGTALQAACHAGNMTLVRLLLKEGALVNAEGGYYGTALQAACTKGHIQVARLLLDHGANIHLRNNGAWHAAVQPRNGDLVMLLLDLGVEVNDPHGPHGTALHAVLRLEWPTDPLYSFIDQNGDGISESELDGLLLWKRIIRFLVNRGADPNLVAGEYGTALQAASAVKQRFPKSIKNEYLGAVGSEFLLELCPSIDINVQGGLFGSALQAAAYSGQTPTVSLLLNKGAHANTRSGKYGSALNAAVIAGNWDIVQILLEAGAVPDCHTFAEPDEEWLRNVLEDKDDGQGAVERYRKFWEVEMASQVDKKKEKAQTSI